MKKILLLLVLTQLRFMAIGCGNPQPQREGPEEVCPGDTVTYKWYNIVNDECDTGVNDLLHSDNAEIVSIRAPFNSFEADVVFENNGTVATTGWVAIRYWNGDPNPNGPGCVDQSLFHNEFSDIIIYGQTAKPVIAIQKSENNYIASIINREIWSDEYSTRTYDWDIVGSLAHVILDPRSSRIMILPDCTQEIKVRVTEMDQCGSISPVSEEVTINPDVKVPSNLSFSLTGFLVGNSYAIAASSDYPSKYQWQTTIQTTGTGVGAIEVINTDPNSNSIQLTNTSMGGNRTSTASVRVKAYNSCGWSEWSEWQSISWTTSGNNPTPIGNPIITQLNGLTLYPSEVENTLYYKQESFDSGPEKEFLLNIYSIKGDFMKSEILSSAGTINVSNLKAGLYIVKSPGTEHKTWKFRKK